MSAVPSEADPSHDSPAPADAGSVELHSAAEAAVAAGPKRLVKGASRLGLLAVFLGIAACVLCRQSMLPSSVHFSPTAPAAAGLVLALLALVGILFGSRAKSGLPLLAVLLCLTAIGISAYQGGARDVDSTRGWANGQIEKYKTDLNRLKNRFTPTGPRTPVSGVNPLAGHSNRGNPQAGQAPEGIGQAANPGDPGGAAATPVNPDAAIGAGTIFDMRPGAAGTPPGITGGQALPASPPFAAPDSGRPSAPFPLVPGPGASLPPTGALPAHGFPLTPGVLSAQAALKTAQGKAKAAEDVFRYTYLKANNPEYLSAKAEVDAADKLVEDAKRRSDGFGQPLIDATRQRKEAQEKVARILNEAMARDAAVAAGRRDLSAAEEALRQAYDAAGRGK